ncbi:MAG TPA: hypothetical protein VJJ81_00605 [Candidatus Babeliales bacterium]|nr:hypothetical protein [Candidatus Babeliales bacterium]
MQKKRDLLYEVYKKSITDEDARLIFEKAQYEFHYGNLEIAPGLYLKLSFAELTLLLLYGLPYSFIAKWRYEGWPTSCTMCNKSIDADLDGWSFSRSLKVGGVEIKNTLICLDCCQVLIKKSEKAAEQKIKCKRDKLKKP